MKYTRPRLMTGAGALTVVTAAPVAIKASEKPEALQIEISAGKVVTIRFPSMSRADLAEVVASVLAPGENTPTLAAVLRDANSLTVILTTQTRG